jgi:hypothetical protein
MKQFELLQNDFVTYVFYFIDSELIHSEIHLLRGELVNELRKDYIEGFDLIENYRNNN